MSNFHRKPEYIKNLSRDLRKIQTESEKLLWERLRWKKLDYLKFLRQKPIFAYRQNNWLGRFYIADFYCHSLRLIIEVDWKIHNNKTRREYDRLRDEILKNNSYKILRFTNDDVSYGIDNIINEILRFKNSILP
ncbi:MAG: protein of unknown function DUF559 [uncultured bacterium (gcode 4)]|uniref:DUF559 domain-containing protein n=1 Tax=uncultured bacterium (gcode 4) TaxID=1234023 RepID=K2G142_9BACT|nr:MAG: protein of unknown function DUF559 [uncultured bacterium (gcode 4)]